MDEIIKHIENGNAIFAIFGLLTLGGAFFVLISKKIFESAIGLLISFLGVAGLMVLSGAEFVAAAQIMIYVGGILVLLIFGIMLTSTKEEKENSVWNVGIFAIVSLALLALMYSLKLANKGTKTVPDIKKIGFSLMTDNIIVLEIVGLLLLMAVVGASFLAKKDE